MTSPKSMASLVRMAIENHTTDDLARGFLRYEVLRKLSPRSFRALYEMNLSGRRFDDLLDEIMNDQGSVTLAG